MSAKSNSDHLLVLANVPLCEDLEQTKTSLAENEKTLSDFTLNCKSEATDYEEGVKSRSLELQALKAAKGALKDGQTARSGPSGPVAMLHQWWWKLIAALKLFFSTIFMPLDPAEKGSTSQNRAGGPPTGPGSNVRRINPGGSSHTQFGSGGDDDNDFMRRGRSVIQSTEDLKHFEVVRMVRTLGQKMEDRQLVLLSRRMDSMLRSEAGSGADIFAKIKTSHGRNPSLKTCSLG
eukprot:g18533.t1